MEQKSALAVYNPQERPEQAIQDAYHHVTGRWLTMAETKTVMMVAGSYLGLSSQFQEHAEAAMADLFSPDPATGYLQIPCFQIELRDILRAKKVVGSKPVAAFSGIAARKILQPYDTLIVVNAEMLGKPIADLGCLKVYDNELSLDGAVVRVLTRQRVDSPNAAAAERIVADECPEAAVYTATDVPGLGYPKVAQALPGMERRFIVNIPALGIKNEPHTATDELQAVQFALNRKFQESGQQHRSPQFTAPFWQQTGFWSMIVRPADEHNRVAMKFAQQNPDLMPFSLTPQESQLFQFLKGINQKYGLNLVMRVSGGWVRDKLLGKDSDDIDIALDKMTGAEFGKYVAKEIGRSGNVIKANPEQSKHLETMTINLFGLDVDFVNLRSETYTDDSRIPKMQFALPRAEQETK